MKCPKCGNQLQSAGDRYHCPDCGAYFKKKTAPAKADIPLIPLQPIEEKPAPQPILQPVSQPAKKAEPLPTLQPISQSQKQTDAQPVLQPILQPIVKREEPKTAEPIKKTAPVSAPKAEQNASAAPKNASEQPQKQSIASEMSDQVEIAILKARLAEMEKKQSQLEKTTKENQKNINSQWWNKFKQTKFFAFMKKWGLSAILPVTLVLIAAITLMVCFIGVRGVYVSVDNPNEFYSFTASKYQYYGESLGEEYIDSGTWKEKDGKIYLTYDDEDFGKQTDEYFFTKKDNDTIFIGEKKDSLKEFKRVQISKYKEGATESVKVTFDYNGASGSTSQSLKKGQKLQYVPEPSRNGCVFKGWYTDKYGYKTSGAQQLDEKTRIWEDITYYANWWSGETYTVSMDDITLGLEEGDLLLPALQLTEKGYTYKYYLSGGALVDENTRMPANSVMITRQKDSAKTIEITLEPIGGTVKGDSKVSVQYGKWDVKFPVCESEGVFFAGYFVWGEDSSTVLVTSETGAINSDFWEYVYEDTTIRALWVNLDNFSDFNYTTTNGITITGYKGTATNVTIPQGTMSISSNAFYGNTTITSVSIPDSVKSIGNGAFSGCTALKSVSVNKDNENYQSKDGILYNKKTKDMVVVPNAISGSISILDGTTYVSGFSGNTAITSVTIPNSVTSIGNYAFSGCTALKSIYVDKDNENYQSKDGVLYNKKTKAIVLVPLSISGSVEILDGTTSIDKLAFRDRSGLKSITIPNSVTSIGEGSFYSCIGLAVVNWNATSCKVSTGALDAFGHCTNLTTINIGNNVTNISTSCFKGITNICYMGDIVGWCGISGLVSIMSSSSTLYIDGNKVEGDLIIPSSVTSIGNYAFYGCTGLTSVTIPDSVTSMGGGAFYECDNLANVYYTGDVAGWCGINGLSGIMLSSRTLYINGSTVEGDLVISDGVTSISSYAFSCRSGLASVTIPDDVTSIDTYAFYGCDGLTSVTIGKSVTSIGAYAFKGCSGLTSITIPTRVTSIESSAFSGCSALETVCVDKNNENYQSQDGVLYNKKTKAIVLVPQAISGSVKILEGTTSIDEYAFSDRSGLKSITISNSVTSMGSGAFYGCKNLTRVTIGEGITNINGAFGSCEKINSVYYSGDVAGWCEIHGLRGLMGEWSLDLKTLYIEDKKIENNLVIPNGVTSIAAYAFYKCIGVTSVTIPDSVTSIGDFAFV